MSIQTKELCPVSSIISPMKYTHPLYGTTLYFLTPIDFKASAEITGSYFKTNADITLTEPNQRTTVLINPASSDFARIWIPGSGSTIGAVHTPTLSNVDRRTRDYSQEGAKNLHVVFGERYEFIVGQNPESIFLDAWLLGSQSPSWRVVIPYQDTRADIVNSRLLTCVQQ